MLNGFKMSIKINYKIESERARLIYMSGKRTPREKEKMHYIYFNDFSFINHL